MVHHLSEVCHLSEETLSENSHRLSVEPIGGFSLYQRCTLCFGGACGGFLEGELRILLTMGMRILSFVSTHLGVATSLYEEGAMTGVCHHELCSYVGKTGQKIVTIVESTIMAIIAKFYLEDGKVESVESEKFKVNQIPLTAEVIKVPFFYDSLVSFSQNGGPSINNMIACFAILQLYGWILSKNVQLKNVGKSKKLARDLSYLAHSTTVVTKLDKCLTDRVEPNDNNNQINLLQRCMLQSGGGHLPMNKTRDKIDVDMESTMIYNNHLNAYTSREKTTYYAHVLKDDVPIALDISIDILQNSYFYESTTQHEHDVILREMEEDDGQTEEVNFYHLHSIAFQNGPLGRTILGPVENMKTISKVELKKYISTHYFGPRTIVSTASERMTLKNFVDSIYKDEVSYDIPRIVLTFPYGGIKLKDEVRDEAPIVSINGYVARNFMNGHYMIEYKEGSLHLKNTYKNVEGISIYLLDIPFEKCEAQVVVDEENVKSHHLREELHARSNRRTHRLLWKFKEPTIERRTVGCIDAVGGEHPTRIREPHKLEAHARKSMANRVESSHGTIYRKTMEQRCLTGEILARAGGKHAKIEENRERKIAQAQQDAHKGQCYCNMQGYSHRGQSGHMSSFKTRE
eukprot:Gb_35825 [translate_table: standard]